MKYGSFSFLLTACLLMAARSSGQRKDPPPIIVIMADQLRADVIGEMTPNISALAQAGVTFTSAYATAPLCAPSRASFFTGLYPNRTHSLINPWAPQDARFGRVRTGIPTMYTLMEEGWDSWHVGKQHLFTVDPLEKDPETKTKWITQQTYAQWMKSEGMDKPGGRVFKALVPEQVSGRHTGARYYSTPFAAPYEPGVAYFTDHYFSNEAQRAIRQRDKSKPLLLNCMFLAPHPPFHIPEPYFSAIASQQVDLPENVGQWYPGQSPLQMYNITGFLGTRYTREEWRDIWTKYLGLVKLLDDEVGRIVQTLKDEGLYEQAIIVFTADHGEMLGSHSLWQKNCMYEESVRVPLYIRFPDGFPVGRTAIDEPVSLMDVLPTLLDYTGVPVPEGLDGQSLLPLVHAKPADYVRPIFLQYDGNGSLGNFQRAVVKDGYKLIADMFGDEVFLELYQITKDPQEKINLAFQQGSESKVLELLGCLKKHMKDTDDHLTIPEDAYTRFFNHYKELD
ncbi:sulfatase [Parapedobacter sp. 2B3]|uniref:sulfatase family protein n=1 Tax=Parapedobacter sp. 2B3 TaxID=3342381 RepID=UPI0035B5C32A